MSLRLAALLLAINALAGCRTPSDHDDSVPAAPSASATVAPALPSSSALARPAPAVSRWAGTYTSAPGTFYVYDGGEWKGVHFRGDDAAVALGDGPLSFAVDAKTNLVRGDGSGPLGDVILSGAVTGDELTFSVLRKDPKDHGLTGTGVGKIAGSSVAGTMRLSRGDAHVIREATFSLTMGAP